MAKSERKLLNARRTPVYSPNAPSDQSEVWMHPYKNLMRFQMKTRDNVPASTARRAAGSRRICRS